MSAPEFDATKNSTLGNGAILGLHILEKGFQTGGFLALTLFGPISAIKLYRATGGLPGFGLSALNIATRSVAWSTGLTVIAGAARVSTYEDKKVALEDRAYRLHYNGTQNRTDQFCRVGAVVGTLGTAALVSASPSVLLGGAGLGAGLAVWAHLLTSNPFAKP